MAVCHFSEQIAPPFLPHKSVAYSGTLQILHSYLVLLTIPIHIHVIHSTRPSFISSTIAMEHSWLIPQEEYLLVFDNRLSL